MDMKSDGRVERYGFAAVPEGTIPVYSANLAILSPDANLKSDTQDFLGHALVFYIDAKAHIRLDRLMTRSSDIIMGKPDEAAMRLAGDKEGVISQSHIILRTRNVESERELYSDTVRVLMRSINEIKAKA